MYSTHLRLADKMSQEEKRTMVEGTIVEMGLQECADTVIDTWYLRRVVLMVTELPVGHFDGEGTVVPEGSVDR